MAFSGKQRSFANVESSQEIPRELLFAIPAGLEYHCASCCRARAFKSDYKRLPSEIRAASLHSILHASDLPAFLRLLNDTRRPLLMKIPTFRSPKKCFCRAQSRFVAVSRSRLDPATDRIALGFSYTVQRVFENLENLDLLT